MVPRSISEAGRVRVLVVDDDQGTRDTLGWALMQSGFDVETASDARRALSMVHSQQYSVALVDLRLPDMSGVDLVRVLRSECSEMACVMMTGFGSVSSAVQAFKYGVCDCVEKPLDPERAIELVRVATGLQNRRTGECELPGDEDPRPTTAYASELLRIIRSRFSEQDLTITRVAEQMRLSPAHLCRVIRFHLQVTRVSEAQKLLRQTSLSVKEIAAAVGYGHRTDRMDRYFTRISGMLPSTYRQLRNG